MDDQLVMFVDEEPEQYDFETARGWWGTTDYRQRVELLLRVGYSVPYKKVKSVAASPWEELEHILQLSIDFALHDGDS